MPSKNIILRKNVPFNNFENEKINKVPILISNLSIKINIEIKMD